MPHSSGGGSHSGGSSGSSFSSGGGSHSGGSHSGSGSVIRTSDSYFTGASRYLYYDSHYRPHYYYSNHNFAAQKAPSKLRWLLLLFYVPFFIVLAIVFFQYGIRIPRKITADYNREAMVLDKADIFSEEEEKDLYRSLNRFLDTTGITPAVITITYNEWQDYETLEDYAYSAYVNAFPDEYHWLIVYATGPENTETGFDNWQWEGMQGDDTDPILTEKMTSAFNASLQKMLTAESRYSKAEAFTGTFDALSDTVMKPSAHWGTIAFLGIGVLFLCLHACMMLEIPQEKMRKKYKNSVKVGASSPEYKCEYCGCAYTKEVKKKYNGACPHCGAPLP